MENLVLFGGSFDPIHNGHLRIAHAASSYLGADVVFVPAKESPGKKGVASAADRLAMLKAALHHDGSPSFSLSTVELDREGDTSYWIDTLKVLKGLYPKRRLYFLLGSDQANQFEKWKEAEEIVTLATPLVVERNGFPLDLEKAKEYRMEILPFSKAGEVSSSAIRSLQDTDFPICVREYIEKRKLYYIGELGNYLSEHRLLHSISVANLAYSIAVQNNLDSPSKAYVAGILHDVAKHLDKLEAVERMKKDHPLESEFAPWTYHEFLGADIAKEKFGVEDEEILEAIRYHATGNAHMTALGKIIYAADKTEPLRGYDSKPMIAEMNRNYYLGFKLVLKENKIFMEGLGYDLDNPLTQACYEQYLGE